VKAYSKRHSARPGRLAAWVVVMCLTAAASAADDAVILRTNRPFSIYTIDSIWAQRFVTLINPTDGPRTVRIVFITTSPTGAQKNFTRTVTLPPRCRRQATLAVNTGHIIASRDKSLKLKRTNEKGESVTTTQLPFCKETYLLLAEDEGTQLDKRIDSILLIPTDPMRADVTPVAYLAREKEAHDSSSYLADMLSQPLGQVLLMQSQPVSLPDHWYGYETASLVMLGGMEADDLRPSQKQALLDWVQRGGTLVILGGRMTGEMLTDWLGPHAGVTSAGLHYTDSLSVTSSGGKHLPMVSLNWPLPMVELCSYDADVLYEANGLPLLTHRWAGQGHVYTLATPAGALENPILHRVWSAVGRGSHRQAPIDAESFAPAAQKTLQAIAGRRGPPRSVPVGILAALAGLVIIAGVALRLKRRGELLWLVLVPTAIVVGAVFYFYGLAQSQPERLSHIALVCGDDAGRAGVQAGFVYYSGPQSRELTISAGGNDGVIWRVTEEGESVLATTRAQLLGGTLVLPDEAIETNVTRSFGVKAVAPLEGIASRLTFGAAGLRGTVTNRTGMDISDAVLYVNRTAYAVGELAGGQTKEVTIGPHQQLSRGEFTSSIARSRTDTLRNSLLRAMAPAGMNVSRRPVLIGYTAGIPLDPLGGRKLQRQGWSVVVWPVKIHPPARGIKMLIPAPMVETRFDYVGAPVWNPRTEQFVGSYRKAELVILSRPPKSAGDISRAKAHINIDIRANNYRLTVHGLRMYIPRATGKNAASGRIKLEREKIRSFDNPVGLKVVTVESADRFRQADGTYAFSVTVERIGAKPARGEAANWKFESANVALEGISR